MARLVLTSPGGAVRSVPLVKRITSVGRGADVDVRLEDAGAIAIDARTMPFDATLTNPISMFIHASCES